MYKADVKLRRQHIETQKTKRGIREGDINSPWLCVCMLSLIRAEWKQSRGHLSWASFLLQSCPSAQGRHDAACFHDSIYSVYICPQPPSREKLQVYCKYWQFIHARALTTQHGQWRPKKPRTIENITRFRSVVLTIHTSNIMDIWK